MTRNSFDGYSESIRLAHVLSRLQAHLLSPSADFKLLRRSKHHRARVAANVNYGRDLLLQLERSLPNIPSPTRRYALQTELVTQRQLLKALQLRIDELAMEGEMRDEDESSSEDEDILPTPAGSTPERAPSREGTSTTGDEKREPQGQLPSEAPAGEISKSDVQPASLSSSAPATSTLRSRHHTASAAHTSRSTAIPSTSPSHRPSITPIHNQTAATSSPSSATQPSSSTHAAEAALTTSRLEQDSLTESLLSLATQLKSSTHTFHTHLESEKSILSRATEGLDRNTTGLEAAGKRMGMLRRMTEGKGWWGRVLMYLWIVGLWIVAVLIVFVGPKLRF
ncbi:hypothetical protein LOY97_004070 [Ophidiomyces ophidiicola]|nr:hypothetical protein LOZ49_005274 [Ophidiomyces ophidiicola]KAI2023204.1 hypothetical protein LOZ46_001534 [Ophidiomyces ophidiicola]KAI2140945.1 hypothetical protein LOZ29_001903 [Ophidiomyces ophidiicola]KAI2142595.1 hypothetical protein LOZ28_002131 [Ophidiomyces ophidiicola]KAI2219510.1 hypothetical protein LOZ15_002637 [Ophidiomyces ophidiicola]